MSERKSFIPHWIFEDFRTFGLVWAKSVSEVLQPVLSLTIIVGATLFLTEQTSGFEWLFGWTFTAAVVLWGACTVLIFQRVRPNWQHTLDFDQTKRGLVDDFCKQNRIASQVEWGTAYFARLDDYLLVKMKF